MAEFAFEFWKRVDELKGKTTITQMCKDLNMKYTRVRDNRSENRYPSKDDIIAIANYLNTSIDYLMTGTGPEKTPPMSAERQGILEALDENPNLEKFVLQYIEGIKDLVR